MICSVVAVLILLATVGKWASIWDQDTVLTNSDGQSQIEDGGDLARFDKISIGVRVMRLRCTEVGRDGCSQSKRKATNPGNDPVRRDQDQVAKLH